MRRNTLNTTGSSAEVPSEGVAGAMESFSFSPAAGLKIRLFTFTYSIEIYFCEFKIPSRNPTVLVDRYKLDGRTIASSVSTTFNDASRMQGPARLEMSGTRA